MNGQLDQALSLLPNYLAWHVALSASALAAGLVISLPLAIAAARRPAVRWPALTFASLIQTIPSLALLALFFPLLLALSALGERWFGHGVSALGFLPAFLALMLYSMLPILRNGVAGLTGVDPAIIEAARGVGMTSGQRLFQVELPLAAPIIMAGLRTAAVWTIGAATLATPVGQTTLGNYIFTGLQTENWVYVLTGCFASAALAIAADQLLGLIERGLANRRRWMIAAGLVGLIGGTALALTPLIATGKTDTYAVGAKNFSEQFILAGLIQDRLEAAGARAEVRQGLGSAVAYRALASGEIDVYVDYTGTLWTNVLNRDDNPGRQAMLNALTEQLQARDGVRVLGPLGFENAYALAMRRDRAKALGVKDLSDLARVAPRLTGGGDIEFFDRPEWAAIQQTYGIRFAARRTFQPTFMYRALQSGEADVISAFSSDGRIAAMDLVVLADPKGAIPPYDAVILITPKRAGDKRLIRALTPLIGAITPQAMRQANYSVDRDEDKLSPDAAAETLNTQIH